MIQTKSTIHVLPPQVTEKIAAGEVVEGPGAVVKELIENSIDAGASRIDITIENAGFSQIKISDNGCGMSAENLQRAVLRHATSKISSLDDLYSLGTLGFRGEALASISAVSRFQIVSADSDEGLGVSIYGEGQQFGTVEPAPRTRGTTITVTDLFYNTPARKKFLKTEKAEKMNINRIVEQMVMPYPSIHFTLTSDGRKILETSSVHSVIDRIAQVTSPDFASSLIRCTGEYDDMEVELYISPPQDARPRPRYQNLYVNLRRINNDSISFALRAAYQSFIVSNLKPSFFCFLSIAPDRIDVNVHPTKQQIKFDEERRLFGFLKKTVERQVAEALNPKDELFEVARAQHHSTGDNVLNTTHTQPDAINPKPYTIEKVQEQATPYPAENSEKNSPNTVGYGVSDHVEQHQHTTEDPQTSLNFPTLQLFNEKTVEQDDESSIQLLNDQRNDQWSLISCYQIHNIFIMAPIKNGVLLIDQHAAHERILYEQALESLKGSSVPSQQLLFPISIELSKSEKVLIEAASRYFRTFGYDIEDFGGNAVSVSAIPAFLKQQQVKDAIRESLDYLLDEHTVKRFPEEHLRFAASFACGSAIKAGQELSSEEMNALLNGLFATTNPYTCPHGRPTLVRLSLGELRRRFLR